MEHAYDDGQLVALPTVRRRALPAQPVPAPAPVILDPAAPRLVQVETVYTAASTPGLAPVLAVAEHFQVTRTTAGRVAGHLPPTNPGKAT